MKEFLSSYKEELLKQKIDLNNSLQKNSIAIQETNKYIQIMEDSKDITYDSFFPQSYQQDTNDKKLIELREKEQELIEKKKCIEVDIKEIDQRLSQIDYLIMQLKKKNSEAIELEEHNKSFLVEKLTNIENKIDLCNKLMDIDRTRCKVELLNLSMLLKNIISSIENNMNVSRET